MISPHFDHNITCSPLEKSFLALVLGFLSLGVWRNLLGGLFFGKVVLYAIGRFTTRVWIGFLHDLVSVFHQNFLSEWLLFNICIYCYLVVICLILETLGSLHTSRLRLHVPIA
jgi:uncharacterized membrane protein